MTIYGVKYLNNGRSLNGKIEYPLNQWIEVPGNGAYIAHTRGLWSAGKKGAEYALFECGGEVVGIDTPKGVKCWRWVKRIKNDGLLGQYLDACAALNPWAALMYAADKLRPERLDACAEAEPWAALKCAAGSLSPERLDACAEAAPQEALMYAADKLSPERLDACAEARPRAALVYAADKLSPERLQKLQKKGF